MKFDCKAVDNSHRHVFQKLPKAIQPKVEQKFQLSITKPKLLAFTKQERALAEMS